METYAPSRVRPAARLVAARARRIADVGWPAGAVLIAGATGLAIALHAGVVGVAAVPAVVRTAVVAVAFFGLVGYVPARFVARGGRLAEHRPLLVLPLGAATSSIALSALGLLHSPLKLSLALVIAGAVVAIVLSARSAAARPTRASLAATARRVVLPGVLAAMVASIALIPIFRAGFATVPGENGDAVIAVGTAVLVQHEPPGANVSDLPINHIPPEWHSKYPIYYALAAVATLAGQDPIAAFPTVAALMLALTALGLFLFASHALSAPPWIALLVVFLVPLDRIVMYVTIHPYYNELWGQFTLPFMLLFGWRLLERPDPYSAVAFAAFLLLGLLAYPLMIPFPVLFLGTQALIRVRRLAADRPGRLRPRLPPFTLRTLLWLPVAGLTVLVAVVLGQGFLEKTNGALNVIFPGQSLAGWSGSGLPFIPFPRFVGMPGSGWLDWIGLVIVCLFAAYGLTRLRPDVRAPMTVMVVVGALIGVYFRVRHGGELFFFKDLAFTGPYAVTVALIGLGALATSPRRQRVALGAGGLACALVIAPAGAAAEIDQTNVQANRSVLQLRQWDHRLPAGTSVRIDIGENAYELWAMYMFSDHPLSALNPLGGFFPSPVVNRKADYVIAERSEPRPRDALGAPLFANAQFELWRMNPNVPGFDLSSRWLVDHATPTAPPSVLQPTFPGS